VPSSDVFVAPDAGVCGAETPSLLRVVTWNLRAALSPSLDQAADDRAALAPDVVMLQQVDRHAARSDDLDQAAVLAERLGMTSTFATARAEGRADFGVALLSHIAFESARRSSCRRTTPSSRGSPSTPTCALVTCTCGRPTCTPTCIRGQPGRTPTSWLRTCERASARASSSAAT